VLGATLLVLFAGFVLLVVMVIASGVDLKHADAAALAASGRFRVLMLAFFLISWVFSARLAMTNPAAAAEPLGPIAILARSWT
jgi:hypothetical protein